MSVRNVVVKSAFLRFLVIHTGDTEVYFGFHQKHQKSRKEQACLSYPLSYEPSASFLGKTPAGGIVK